MEYKTVKNSNKPGRPPSNCVWIKDDEGKLKTNAKGQIAFRPKTEEELNAKKTVKKYKPKKGTRGRKAAPALSDDQKSALLLKKTYKDLTAAELEKIKTIVEGLVDGAKEAERVKLEKQINKLQGKLSKLA
jgi:hypothetical protein